MRSLLTRCLLPGLLLTALLVPGTATWAQDAGVAPVGTGARGAEPQPAPDAAEPPPPPPPPPPPAAPAAGTRVEAPGSVPAALPPAALPPAAEPAPEADAAAETEAREGEGAAAVPEPSPSPAVEPPRAAAPPETRVERLTERHTETRFVPMPQAEADGDPLTAELEELALLFGQDRSLGALGLLLIGLLLAGLAAFGVRRVRDRLPLRGIVPAVLALVHLGLRLIAVAFALTFLIRMLPPRATLVMLLAFGGFAVALGWSARDVLPDLLAGFLLVFERRIRAGMWVVGEDFAGQVERVGVRSSLLTDVMGRHLEVPNRKLVNAPLTSDAAGEREHEVLVRFQTSAAAEQVRAALRDAVLASPWVHPGVAAVVLRDPDEPWLWRVRGRLLDPSLVSRFEGDLLERAEEILGAFEHRGRSPHDEPERAPISHPTEGDAL